MNQFLVFVRKEFYHIFRDYRTMLVLFGMPIAQILLFGFALSTEVKETNMAIFDQSGDVLSQQIIDEFNASKYFEVKRLLHAHHEIEKVLLTKEIKTVMVIPPNAMQQLSHENSLEIQLINDASDPNLANTLINYAHGIINDYQSRRFPTQEFPMQINIQSRMLFNPQLIGAYMFVPGVITIILMLICAMMTSVAIVKEKEMGTLEVLLVSPLRKITFVTSKAVPYLFLSWLIVAVVLLLSVFVLDVPIKGNFLLLFVEITLYIITCLSLGLMISNIVQSQQTAMMISLIGLMLPTIMLSGFMFPIENMPLPLQIISNIIPAKWFFQIIIAIMIKGLGFAAIWKESLILMGFTVFLLTVSISKFKKRLI